MTVAEHIARLTGRPFSVGTMATELRALLEELYDRRLDCGGGMVGTYNDIAPVDDEEAA